MPHACAAGDSLCPLRRAKKFFSGLSIFSLHKEDTALPEGRSRILVYFLSYSVFRIPAVKLKTRNVILISPALPHFILFRPGDRNDRLFSLFGKREGI